MKQRLACGATACLAFFGPAMAEQTYSNDGVGMAKSTSVPYVIGEGHVVMQIASRYSDLKTDDASNPLNGATGPCFGSVEITAGQISGGGHCVYTDKEGDMAVLTWASEQLGEGGANMGSWSLIGGSGKYAGATGGGTFDASAANETGDQTNVVTGQIILK